MGSSARSRHGPEVGQSSRVSPGMRALVIHHSINTSTESQKKKKYDSNQVAYDESKATRPISESDNLVLCSSLASGLLSDSTAHQVSSRNLKFRPRYDFIGSLRYVQVHGV